MLGPWEHVDRLQEATTCLRKQSLIGFDIHRNCILSLGSELDPLGDVVVNLELSLAPLQVHVPDLSVNTPFLPALIVNAAYTPSAANVTVRVSPIQLVPFQSSNLAPIIIPVVQINGDVQGLFGRLGPFQNLLCPVHSVLMSEVEQATRLINPCIFPETLIWICAAFQSESCVFARSNWSRVYKNALLSLRWRFKEI